MPPLVVGRRSTNELAIFYLPERDALTPID
jgi:hypothetical protein